MTDIVKRLKTFVAPENWDADQLIFDATKEIERLRSVKFDSSQLDIEVESLKARVKQLEAALEPFAKAARCYDDDVRGDIMTGIIIPPAALEAGAKALCAKAGYAWTVTPDVHAHWREQARAAFLAMIEAWEGMQHDNYVIILPLTEKTDDKA